MLKWIYDDGMMSIISPAQEITMGLEIYSYIAKKN